MTAKHLPLVRSALGAFLLGWSLTCGAQGYRGVDSSVEIVFERCGSPGKDHLCSKEALQELTAKRKAAAEKAEQDRILKEQLRAEKDRQLKPLTDQYGQHRRAEMEKLLEMRQKAATVAPTKVDTKPRSCRKESVSRTVSSGVPLPSRSEAEARIRLPVGLCPNGETPSRGGMSCNSEQRTITIAVNDPCFKSTKTCPKQTVWTCSEIFSCATPREICEAVGPTGASRQ